MDDHELQTILVNNPSFIEEGLEFKGREVQIGSGRRCDLLFADINGHEVYAEVKWVADDQDAARIGQYEALGDERAAGARFILAAVSARPGVEKMLKLKGIEFVKISSERLTAIRPDWKAGILHLIASTFHSATRHGNKPRELTRHGALDKQGLLLHLLGALRDELPKMYLDRGIKPRLLLKWTGEDYYNFYFPSKISQAFRCAFVLDLDLKKSPRRNLFRNTLLENYDTVADIYGYPVILHKADEKIAQEENYSTWIKIMRHRWYSLYAIYRNDEINWQNKDEVVGFLVPKVFDFMGKTDFLIQRFKPPFAEEV